MRAARTIQDVTNDTDHGQNTAANVRQARYQSLVSVNEGPVLRKPRQDSVSSDR